jgi:hypothetical protein
MKTGTTLKMKVGGILSLAHAKDLEIVKGSELGFRIAAIA